MDSTRLRELLNLLTDKEKEISVQSKMSSLVESLNQLVGSPQQIQFQTNVSTGLEQFKEAMNQIRHSFEPSQIKSLEEIGAKHFFVDDLSGAISALIQENPLSPAVVHQYVNKLRSERQQYLDSITQLRDRLEEIGVKASTPLPGEAEVGFKIPRDLFDNNLEGLIGELREIRFIIRSFSEAATGSVEPIIVRQISTTDPLFFFAVGVGTIALIGRVTRWVLETWKTVEEIRKIRGETQKLAVPREKDILEMFDKSITEKITSSIQGRVKELVPENSDGRPKELQNHLTIALESMFARIERGMSVEIRFMPPTTNADTGSVTDTSSAAFATLAETVPHLLFPPTAGDPILQLPRASAQRGDA